VFGAGLPADIDDKVALVTFAGDDHILVVPASFKNGFQTVEAEVVFGPLGSVAINTRRLENGLDVFGEGDAFLGGGRRQLGEVNGEDRGGQAQSGDRGEAGCGGNSVMSHDNLSHCDSNVWPSDGGNVAAVTLAVVIWHWRVKVTQRRGERQGQIAELAVKKYLD
jgi:hypothetical protein